MEVNVYNIKGEDTGRKITLNESIFGIEPNDHALSLDVKQLSLIHILTCLKKENTWTCWKSCRKTTSSSKIQIPISSLPRWAGKEAVLSRPARKNKPSRKVPVRANKNR